MFQPRYLNVVALVAILFQTGHIRGYERKPLDNAPQPDVAGRWVDVKLHAAERLRGPGVMTAIVVERPHPQSLGSQQTEVDVGHRPPRPVGEPFALGEQPPVLPDHRLAVPRQIGARLADPRSRVDVRGQAACRRRAGQQGAIFGARDRDRTAGQVGQHRRAGQRGFGARRHRDEHVLTHLDVQHETGNIGRVEQQIGTEWDVSAAEPEHPADIVAGGEMSPLVELAVGRQVRLGYDTEDPAAVHHDRGVVDAVPVAQRCTDHQHRHQLGGGADDVCQRVVGGVEQRVLQQDVLDRIPRQRQLGKHRQCDAVIVTLAGQCQHRFGVGRRLRDRGVDRARGNTDETVPVRRVEIHTTIVSCDRRGVADTRQMHAE